MLACSAKAQFPSTYRITDYMRYALTNYTQAEAQSYFGISNSGGTTVTNVYITNLFTTNISYLNGTNTYLAGYTTNDSIISTNFIGNGRNITNVSTTNLVGQFNSTNIFGLWNLTNTFGQLNASNAIFGNWNLTNTFGNLSTTNLFGLFNTTNLFGLFNSTNIFGLWNETNTFGLHNATNSFGLWNLTNTYGNINLTNTYGTYVGDGSGITGTWVKTILYGGIPNSSTLSGARFAPAFGFIASPNVNTNICMVPLPYGGYLSNFVLTYSTNFATGGTNMVVDWMTNKAQVATAATTAGITVTMNQSGLGANVQQITNDLTHSILCPPFSSTTPTMACLRFVGNINLVANSWYWTIEWWHQNP